MLLVLMAMIVMTLLALEFQQEAVMQTRMSKHRQNLVQCEYALESGLVASGKLIQEYNDDMIERIRRRMPAQSAEDAEKEDKQKEEFNNLNEELQNLDPNQFTDLIDQVQQIATDNKNTNILNMINGIDLENLDTEIAAPVLAGIMTLAEDNDLHEITDIINNIVNHKNESGVDQEMLEGIFNEVGVIALEQGFDDITTILEEYSQLTDPNIDAIYAVVDQIKAIAIENDCDDIIVNLELIDQALTTDTGSSSNEAIPELWEEHLLKKHSLEIGNATVDIFIYGENYKLPLIWALKSIIGRQTPRDNDYNMQLVKDLIDELDPGNPYKQDIVDYLAELTDGIEIPFSTGVYKGRNNLWTRRPYTSTNRLKDLWVIRNHINFASVGGQWNRDISNPHYQEVKDMVTLPSGNLLSDYLGIWGSNYININTAPVEVLTVGLKDIGITKELAQKIIDWRESKSMFLSPRDVKQIEGIDSNMAGGVFSLTTVIDNVFTVRVVATIGDVVKIKQACYHKKGSRLELQAVY